MVLQSCVQEHGADSSAWQLLYWLQSADKVLQQHLRCAVLAAQSWVRAGKPWLAGDMQAATLATPQHCWGTT